MGQGVDGLKLLADPSGQADEALVTDFEMLDAVGHRACGERGFVALGEE